MSFMTGRHLQHIGIRDNGVPLPEDAPTRAHRVRAAGYRAALAGKMHFRGFDQLHGFESQPAIDINARNLPQRPDWSRPLPQRAPGARTGSWVAGAPRNRCRRGGDGGGNRLHPRPGGFRDVLGAGRRLRRAVVVRHQFADERAGLVDPLASVGAAR